MEIYLPENSKKYLERGKLFYGTPGRSEDPIIASGNLSIFKGHMYSPIKLWISLKRDSILSLWFNIWWNDEQSWTSMSVYLGPHQFELAHSCQFEWPTSERFLSIIERFLLYYRQEKNTVAEGFRKQFKLTLFSCENWKQKL
jgi:hypothetical protein